MKQTFLAIALFLSACAGDAQTRATSALAISCNSYATLLDQITPLRAQGKISAVNVARVDASNNLTKIACAKGSTLDPAAAVETVERGIVLLTAIKDAI